jgi:pyruvate kinase
MAPETDSESSEATAHPTVEASAVRLDLMQIRDEMVKSLTPKDIHQEFRSSAVNLLHYLSLRRHDLRDIQDRLAELGLSSLGRAEPHVLATLDAVLGALSKLGQTDDPALVQDPGAPDFRKGHELLTEHTNSLLGSAPAARKVRIMVTIALSMRGGQSDR